MREIDLAVTLAQNSRHMISGRAIRICRARASASTLEAKARANPDRATELTELARKLRVGATMLEARVREANLLRVGAPARIGRGKVMGGRRNERC